MATQNHQKMNGAAKRSGRTTRSRSLAAIMAGATLGGVLAAGGALGFIGAAKAVTDLNGRTFIDIDGNGRLDPNVNPAFSDRPVGGVTVTAFERGGVVAGTTAKQGRRHLGNHWRSGHRTVSDRVLRTFRPTPTRVSTPP